MSACLLLLMMLQIGPPPEVEAANVPPNIVVIVSDDAGWADFGFQGSTQVETPNLDALRASGVRFERGYVTASVCSPSRAGLLSGQYQQRFGHEANIGGSGAHGMPASVNTLAERLSETGYVTEAIGKWHLGYQPGMKPLDQGFDRFHGLLAGSRKYKPLPNGDKTPMRRLRDNDTIVPDEASQFSWLTDHLGDTAAASVARLTPGDPYLLYLCFTAPHTPMQASAEDLAAVAEGVSGRRRTYVAMQRALDRAVGRVLDSIEASGEIDRTIVWFVNDNGGATTNASDNGPLRGMKGSKFEGGIRVPMLLRWPSVVAAGATLSHPVSTLDIAPTLLASAGVSDRVGLDGVDLRPYLEGDLTTPPHAALFWRRGPIAAVLEGDRWKLIRIKADQSLLFDLEHDPGEQINVAEAQPEIRDRLERALANWEREMSPPGWKSGDVWIKNQIRKHQPKVDSREKERSLP